jgi:hypothetical protein
LFADQIPSTQLTRRRLRRLVRGTLVAVACVAFSAWADPPQSTDEVQAILGASWQALRACKVDSDCVLIDSFVHCCQKMSIGKKYQDAVNKKQRALRQKLTPPEVQRHCSLVECELPHVQASCRENQCTAVSPAKDQKDADMR